MSGVFIDLIYFILFSADNHKMGFCLLSGRGAGEQDAAVILDLRVDWGFSHPPTPAGPAVRGQEGNGLCQVFTLWIWFQQLGCFQFSSASDGSCP